jgi:hypothetical protein
VVQRWATGWMIGGSSPGRGWEFFYSLPRPERLWSPPSLLSNGHQELLPWDKGTGVKLTTILVLRSRMHGAIPPLPQYAFMAWCSFKNNNFTFTFYLYLRGHRRLLVTVFHYGLHAYMCKSNTQQVQIEPKIESTPSHPISLKCILILTSRTVIAQSV